MQEKQLLFCYTDVRTLKDKQVPMKMNRHWETVSTMRFGNMQYCGSHWSSFRNGNLPGDYLKEQY